MASDRKRQQKSQDEKDLLSVKTCLFGNFVKADEVLDQSINTIQTLTRLLNGCDLPPKMKRLLAVKLLPGSAFLSVRAKCRLAECDDSYWYICHSKPQFIEACQKYSREVLSRMMIPEIIGTHVTKAMLGDNKAARLILEYARELEAMAGERTGFGGITLNADTINIIEQDNLQKGMEKFGIKIPAKRFSDN